MIFPAFVLQVCLAGLTGGVWWHTQHPFPFGSFVVCVLLAIHGAMLCAGRKS